MKAKDFRGIIPPMMTAFTKDGEIYEKGTRAMVDFIVPHVQGLYPERMNALTVAEFLEALPELDEAFRTQVEDARDRGEALRFAAKVTDGQCSAGPVTVSNESPLGRLAGTDNLVEFATRWYNPNPLVIQGRGAGVDATAAGVLSDMIELAHTT